MDKQKIIMIVLVIIICISVVIGAANFIKNKNAKPKGELTSTVNEAYREYQNLADEEKNTMKEQYNAIMENGIGIDDLNKPFDVPEEFQDYIYKPAIVDPAKEFLGIE